MNNSEFSDQFDVLYNNITSNQAPGLNEYEKSVFLTKAEKEIVKNYFSAGSLGNNLHQGFDDSAKRQADFSVLMKTALCTQVSSPGTATSPRTFIFTTDEETIVLHGVTFTNTTTLEEESLPDGEYYCQYQGNALQTYFAASGNVYTIDTDESDEEIPSVNCTLKVITNAADRIDPRSGVWSFPSDVFIVINEALYTVNSKILQLVPLRYDEYTRLMSKPFKYPVKNQAQQRQSLIVFSSCGAFFYIISNVSGKYVIYPVVRSVFAEQIIVVGKRFGDLFILQILAYHLFIDTYAVLLVESDHVGQVEAGGARVVRGHAAGDDRQRRRRHESTHDRGQDVHTHVGKDSDARGILRRDRRWHAELFRHRCDGRPDW